MTTATNPFIAIAPYARTFGVIALDTFTNDNAKAFYGEVLSDTYNAVQDFTIDGWEAYSIAVINAFNMAIAILEDAMPKADTPVLAPVNIAGYLPPAKVDPIIDTSWIDWKVYLNLIFRTRRY